jgi:hypothetical protein
MSRAHCGPALGMASAQAFIGPARQAVFATHRDARRRQWQRRGFCAPCDGERPEAESRRLGPGWPAGSNANRAGGREQRKRSCGLSKFQHEPPAQAQYRRYRTRSVPTLFSGNRRTSVVLTSCLSFRLLREPTGIAIDSDNFAYTQKYVQHPFAPNAICRLFLYACLCNVTTALAAPSARGLTLERSGTYIVVHGNAIPGESLRINYLDAYCRANSTDADWVKHTRMGHKTDLLSLSDDRKVMRLRDTVADGLIVEHTITARQDEVEFQLVATNPTSKRSEAHWAQACPRLHDFTGFTDTKNPDLEDYLPKCFVFINGKLERMPTPGWETRARMTPGQVWRPQHVPKDDVNPRPVNKFPPSNGLIGCFSKDEKMVWATAWEPYQELFQGVVRCLHADFRLGGLQPGETKLIRGKMYIVRNDMPALLARYEKEFPDHFVTAK